MISWLLIILIWIWIVYKFCGDLRSYGGDHIELYSSNFSVVIVFIHLRHGHVVHVLEIIHSINLDKFFIMSTEFDKDISDNWSYDCTDHKNDIDFFMRLFKWPKIDVKKCQIWFSKSIFNIKNHSNLSKKHFVGEYQFRSTFFIFINCVAWKLNDFCS